MTFQNLLEQLEKKKPDLGSHIDTFQTFAGAAACLAGDSAAGGLPALLAALAEKEKLFDLGKFLLDRIAGEKPEDYSGIDTISASSSRQKQLPKPVPFCDTNNGFIC